MKKENLKNEIKRLLSLADKAESGEIITTNITNVPYEKLGEVLFGKSNQDKPLSDDDNIT